jgi:serine/threonine-protein kinase
LLDADSGQTRTGAVLGTPAYMPPEQTAGDPAAVGPAADVYALGAILYECLTGRPPFKAASALETMDLVRTSDPVPPRRLQPKVPRDLETVCLTCLAKEPAKRYATAAALADDLDRVLGGRPILARPAGAAERAWKWCRRRPALAALVAVSALGTAAGAIGVAVHADRLRREADRANRGEELADANYRDARAALQRMLGRLTDGRRAAAPALKELQREQAEDALAFYQSIADQPGDRPEVRADAARAGLEAGRLQLRLGRSAESEAGLRRVADQFAALAAEFPAEADYRAGRADALSFLGDHFRDVGRFDVAQVCHAEALALREALADERPASGEFREAVASSLAGLGSVAYSRQRLGEAEARLRAAIALRERPAGGDPPTPAERHRLAQTWLNLSIVLQQSPRDAESRAAHDRAEALFDRLLRDDPDDAESALSLAMLRINWSYMLAAWGQSDTALADLAKNVQLLEPLLAREPNDAEVRDRLHRTHGARANILGKAGRYAESVPDWERVIALAPPARRNYHCLLLAEALARAGDYRRAVAVTREAAAGLADRPDWNQPLHLAGVSSLAAAAADRALASAERERLTGEAVTLSLELLAKAQAAAPPEEWRKRLPELARDEDFAFVRNHPEFQRLVPAVGGPTPVAGSTSATPGPPAPR